MIRPPKGTSAFCLRCLFFSLLIALQVFGYTSPLWAEEFKLKSPSFADGQPIPALFTCDGKDRSPALNWSGAPLKTQSFMLVVEDPDAPLGTFIHWVLFNLPPSINNLPEGMPAIKTLANNESHGLNSFRKLGYGGPCPPSGKHRYYFRLYALDAMLPVEAGIQFKDLMKAARKHILAKTEMMGTYARNKS